MNRIILVLIGMLLLSVAASAQPNTPLANVMGNDDLNKMQVMGIYRFDKTRKIGDNYVLLVNDTISGGALRGVALDTSAIYPVPADTTNFTVGLMFDMIDTVNASVTVDWYYYATPDSGAVPWLTGTATTQAIVREVARASATPYAVAIKVPGFKIPPGVTHFRIRTSWAATGNAMTSGSPSTVGYTKRPTYSPFYTWRARIQ